MIFIYKTVHWCPCRGVVGGFFAILCSSRISLPMFNLLTSDVNMVTLVLRMILACVKCRQKPLEIEGYCIYSREVKIQKQKTIKP